MMIVQLAGRLGRDAETRFTNSGIKVTTLTLATNQRKGSGKEEVTTWWRVTIWGDRFDKLLPYLKKGSAIIVVGEMNKPEIWTDKEGRPQVSLEVTAEIIRFSPFGGPERSQDQQTAPGIQSTPQQTSTAGYGGAADYSAHFGGGSQGTAASQELAEDPLPF